MSPTDVAALTPAALFLLGALLCLLLEAAGTPVGATKQGSRPHLAIISLLTCLAVAVQSLALLGVRERAEAVFGALVVDGFGTCLTLLIAAALFATVLSAVPALRELDEERGEVYALLLVGGAALSVIVRTDEVLLLAGGLLLLTVSWTALASLERRAPFSAEAAVKLSTFGGLSLSLLGFGSALGYGATGGTSIEALASGLVSGAPLGVVGFTLVVVVLLAWLAAVPLHVVRVDAVHGAPPFAGALFASGGLLAAFAVLVRLFGAVGAGGGVPPTVHEAMVAGVLLALTAPALAALDQRRVRRMVAHLSCLPAGSALLVLLLIGDGHEKSALAPGLLAVLGHSLSALGAVSAVAFFERPGSEGGTWERWSGAGRRHPLFSLALLFLLASLAGLPGTAGFAAHLAVGKAAFAEGYALLGVALLVAPAVAVAPVLRLAIFLFAKSPDRALQTAPDGWRAVATAFLVGAVAVLCFVAPAFVRWAGDL